MLSLHMLQINERSIGTQEDFRPPSCWFNISNPARDLKNLRIATDQIAMTAGAVMYACDLTCSYG